MSLRKAEDMDSASEGDLSEKSTSISETSETKMDCSMSDSMVAVDELSDTASGPSKEVAKETSRKPEKKHQSLALDLSPSSRKPPAPKLQDPGFLSPTKEMNIGSLIICESKVSDSGRKDLPLKKRIHSGDSVGKPDCKKLNTSTDLDKKREGNENKRPTTLTELNLPASQEIFSREKCEKELAKNTEAEMTDIQRRMPLEAVARAAEKGSKLVRKDDDAANFKVPMLTRETCKVLGSQRSASRSPQKSASRSPQQSALRSPLQHFAVESPQGKEPGTIMTGTRRMDISPRCEVPIPIAGKDNQCLESPHKGLTVGAVLDKLVLEIYHKTETVSGNVSILPNPPQSALSNPPQSALSNPPQSALSNPPQSANPKENLTLRKILKTPPKTSQSTIQNTPQSTVQNPSQSTILMNNPRLRKLLDDPSPPPDPAVLAYVVNRLNAHLQKDPQFGTSNIDAAKTSDPVEISIPVGTVKSASENVGANISNISNLECIVKDTSKSDADKTSNPMGTVTDTSASGADRILNPIGTGEGTSKSDTVEVLNPVGTVEKTSESEAAEFSNTAGVEDDTDESDKAESASHKRFDVDQI